MNISEIKFSELASIFCLPGTIKSVDIISNGNINGTFDVTMEYEGVEKRYVFQKSISMFSKIRSRL